MMAFNNSTNEILVFVISKVVVMFVLNGSEYWSRVLFTLIPIPIIKYSNIFEDTLPSTIMPPIFLLSLESNISFGHLSRVEILYDLRALASGKREL